MDAADSKDWDMPLGLSYEGTRAVHSPGLLADLESIVRDSTSEPRGRHGWGFRKPGRTRRFSASADPTTNAHRRSIHMPDQPMSDDAVVAVMAKGVFLSFVQGVENLLVWT